MVLEPIQGETGVVVPPDGYLRAAREVCDRHGVLLVVDEVQTGMGRTGKMWACEHEDVVPDILTTAKGLGGGVAPVGAMVARPPLWEPMIRDPLIHTTTFGNRLGWAAAAATIRVILEENLLPRAAAIGERLMAGLRRAAGDAAGLVTDVRGRGCLVGVEFVDADVAFLVLSGMLQRQVLAFYSTNRREVIRFAPPLIASDAQVDRAIDVFAEALAEAKALVAEVGAG
ncbi:MAG: aminotransferase class III-fold pyridoxal phosphate-dependent enzyme [Armatimonadota bacterium]|nr:aminotransferase class III-fold pyridoxal phosphate-dependent enzyme [Armatimonadota bacterium]